METRAVVEATRPATGAMDVTTATTTVVKDTIVIGTTIESTAAIVLAGADPTGLLRMTLETKATTRVPVIALDQGDRTIP